MEEPRKKGLKGEGKKNQKDNRGCHRFEIIIFCKLCKKKTKELRDFDGHGRRKWDY